VVSDVPAPRGLGNKAAGLGNKAAGLGRSAGDAVVAIPDEVQDRVEHWRVSTFGPASETPFRRRTSDWIKVVAAGALLAFAISRHDHLPDWEKSLFEFFNQMPDTLKPLFATLYRLGTLWAVGLVLCAALIARRWRLARDLAIAAAAAWLVGRFMGLLTEGSTPSAALSATVRIGSGTPSFPVVRLAVIVAVLLAAGPYLTRPSRRVGLTVIVAMSLASMYLGRGLPNAVVAAVVLGWGVAAAVHLAFGSPGGRPTLPQMAAALRELGIDATDLQLCEAQAPDATLMTARDAGGVLALRVLGRDEGDAQFLRRTWGSVVFKTTPGTLHLTRLSEVEHHGYSVLRAAQAGVSVPTVVATGTAGPGAAVYVERPVGGRTFAELSPDELTDDLLVAAWRAVALLHGVRLAHLSLDLDHVVVTDDGDVAITGWDDAVSADVKGFHLRDVAALLVGTAVKVGNDRAVAAAREGVGDDELQSVLPVMQTVVLPASMRAHGHKARKELAEQVSQVRTDLATALGVEAPQLTELHRVSGTNLLMVVGTFLGVAALLSQVGSPQELWDTMSTANWAWIALAVAVSLSTNVATAIALMGSVPITIPLARTTELQLSLTFANLAVPTIGGLASQIRYLQKQGVDLAAATTAGGVISGIANVVVTGGVFVVALLLSPKKVDVGSVSADSVLKVLIIAAVLVGVVSAVVFGVPQVRAKVIQPLESAWETISAVARSPRQIFELVLGWASNALLYAFVLYCCVAAFGPPVNFWTIVVINTAVSTLAFAVPVPGGATAVSSVGVAGALTAVGASQEVAVAASLAYQVTATFIPAVPGWFAFRNLLDLDYL